MEWWAFCLTLYLSGGLGFVIGTILARDDTFSWRYVAGVLTAAALWPVWTLWALAEVLWAGALAVFAR